ncbi:MAG: hypothetical protein MZV63_07395 [Marinilabiliales bacterium]|nr:hypothetical protein [Marinilabiliales bacterium]
MRQRPSAASPAYIRRRFAGEGRDFSANIDKLLELLDGKMNRKAKVQNDYSPYPRWRRSIFLKALPTAIITKEKRRRRIWI